VGRGTDQGSWRGVRLQPVRTTLSPRSSQTPAIGCGCVISCLKSLFVRDSFTGHALVIPRVPLAHAQCGLPGHPLRTTMPAEAQRLVQALLSGSMGLGCAHWLGRVHGCLRWGQS
jgi:hypothetical protein